ncbi:nitronate monooxygenase [Nocardia sp. NEAU-G5]|uniref:Nitronate monooxygenase n=1 Tax=Nocardia albiluteola TaxID=2842303 RepID=A0ABS6B081_9NOCA|nr:nitronate monooxygenase [Nocardia albiluteola]MBU3063707.1 nitronate monooxygenase [Nocardia albiluteola]
MTLRTAFTDALSIRHPIASAPMGGEAGGALAAAVSEGGGLGLVGGGHGDLGWLEPELRLAAAGTERPWGVGFLTWGVREAAIARALEFRPAAVLLSFGDPTPFTDRIHASDALLILQVSDVDSARRALDLGADIIVAQGSDAGGHMGENGTGTLSFVPTIVDLAGPVPVLAAGGIADGRALAAVLTLGAAGAMIGTRFQATAESLVDPKVRQALVNAHGEDTETNRTLDIARGSAWPHRYPARTLRNAFLDTWRGRDEELRADLGTQREFTEAMARVDLDAAPVWAGQAVDRVTRVDSAAEVVAALAAEAKRALSGIRID